MFVSEYAFDEALTREKTAELRRAYKAANMQQFHSMNAATINVGDIKWLYSYYTAIVGFRKCDNDAIAYIYVQPFIWDTNYYINSRTTNKQTNRWLKEHGFCFSVSTLRDIYTNAKQGLSSYPLYMQDGTLVIPRFSSSQYTLDYYGVITNELHCNEVPWLKYSDDNSALIKDGRYVHFGDVCGLVE